MNSLKNKFENCKVIDILNKNYNKNKSYSFEKDKKRTKNKICKLKLFPKLSQDSNKLNINFNPKINKLHRTPKITKKLLNLIPFDKKYNLNKQHKLIINNHFENDDNNNNLNINISLSSKNNKKSIHNLFICHISNQNKEKKNKSSPKLFLKHPSFKNLFDSV